MAPRCSRNLSRLPCWWHASTGGSELWRGFWQLGLISKPAIVEKGRCSWPQNKDTSKWWKRCWRLRPISMRRIWMVGRHCLKLQWHLKPLWRECSPVIDLHSTARERVAYSDESSLSGESKGSSIKNSDADFFSRLPLFRSRRASTRSLVFGSQLIWSFVSEEFVASASANRPAP